jgi:hypothetical protein
MAFSETFPANGALEALATTIMAYQRAKIANLINIQGRNAQVEDGSNVNVNIAEFEPQDRRNQVRKNLKFVRKADATVTFRSQMTAEGRTQVGGEMNVFIENTAVTILIFGKMT